MIQYTTEALSRRGFLAGLGGAVALGAGGLSLNKQYTKSKEEDNAKDLLKQLSAQLNTNGQILLKTALASGITGTELAQFMAQASVETGSFTDLVERNWSNRKFIKRYEPRGKTYKDADGILSTSEITKRVKSITNPRARVLGNVLPGDGERYKGRGYFQLTGRWNYTTAAEDTGLDLIRQPELAADPYTAAKLAIWYWNTRVKPKINNFADTEAVTKLINSASHNLVGRKARFNIYKRYIK